MPSLFSGGTGVEVEGLQLLVVHDLKNMGMATDKKCRRIPMNFLFHLRTVTAGIPANMGHPYIHLFAPKAQMLRVPRANIPPVYIAVYATKRLYGSQCIGYCHVSEISCVPYFIAVGKVLEDCVVKITVGIRQQADFGHGYINMLNANRQYTLRI